MLIGGSHAESDAVSRIQGHSRHPLISLIGRAPLLTFAALARRCELFVGNDNGAAHIAAAVATPSVVLFGPSDPAEWAPIGPSVVTLYKGLDCSPCYRSGCRRGNESCMQQITVDEVWEAAERIRRGMARS